LALILIASDNKNLHSTANSISLFMIYLTTLSLAEFSQRRVVGC